MLCGVFTAVHGGGLGRGGYALIDAEMILGSQKIAVMLMGVHPRKSCRTSMGDEAVCPRASVSCASRCFKWKWQFCII